MVTAQSSNPSAANTRTCPSRGHVCVGETARTATKPMKTIPAIAALNSATRLHRALVISSARSRFPTAQYRGNAR